MVKESQSTVLDYLGNPILGDGKSDNQNHSLIFCRGEYIQLVDANQDNYLEECLKIRSILAEFEEATFPWILTRLIWKAQSWFILLP